METKAVFPLNTQPFEVLPCPFFRAAVVCPLDLYFGSYSSMLDDHVHCTFIYF